MAALRTIKASSTIPWESIYSISAVCSAEINAKKNLRKTLERYTVGALDSFFFVFLLNYHHQHATSQLCSQDDAGDAAEKNTALNSRVRRRHTRLKGRKKNTKIKIISKMTWERRPERSWRKRSEIRLKKSLRRYLSCHVECRLKTRRTNERTTTIFLSYSSFQRWMPWDDRTASTREWWVLLEFKLWPMWRVGERVEDCFFRDQIISVVALLYTYVLGQKWWILMSGEWCCVAARQISSTVAELDGYDIFEMLKNTELEEEWETFCLKWNQRLLF